MNILHVVSSLLSNEMYKTLAVAISRNWVDPFLYRASTKSRKSDSAESVKIGSSNIGSNSTASTQAFVGDPCVVSKNNLDSICHLGHT